MKRLRIADCGLRIGGGSSDSISAAMHFVADFVIQTGQLVCPIRNPQSAIRNGKGPKPE